MKNKTFYKTSVKAMTGVSMMAMMMATQGAMAQQNDDEQVVEEVIVTAGRREQSLIDVPAAVTTFSPDDFKFKGQNSLEDILKYAPSINYTGGGAPGGGTLSARGVPQSSATPVFGIYLDDTPMTSNTNFSNGAALLLDGLLFDIERVEVIKGPQGTLFGATSVGGLLRYITRDPSTDEYRATASIDYADTSGGSMSQIYSGRVSIPVAKDKLGVTFAGYYKDVGGYVDTYDGTGALLKEDVNDGQVKGYSADVLMKPTDELEVRFKYLGQENEYKYNNTVNLLNENSTDGLFSGYSAIGDGSPGDLQFDIMSGTINYDFGNMTLSSTTSRTEYKLANEQDLTAGFAAFVDFLGGRDPGTTTHVGFIGTSGAKKIVHETRLTSANNDKLEWTGGFFYTKEETHNIQDAPVIPEFNLLYASFPSVYKEYAGFANATVYVNDKFDVSGGVRVSKNNIALDFFSSGVLAGETDIQGTVLKDTIETYLMTGRYKVAENISIYARMASGYRPAQGNLPIIDPATQRDIAPPIVFADKAWSYETGIKGRSDDGKVSYDLAVWKIDWANFQSPVVLNGVSTGGNAEDGLSAYGFEGSVTANSTKNFSVTANFSYTNSILNEDEPSFEGTKGENIPNLPKWKGSLQWNYSFAVGGDWSGNFGGGFRYSGAFNSYYIASTVSASTEVKSRILGDLNVGFTNGNVNIGLYATNVFNSRSLTTRSDSILNGVISSSTGAFERPRTIGLNLRYSY